MQWHRAILGAVVDLQDVNPHGNGFVYVMPKDASRRQVSIDIHEALLANHMSMAQAAKTRGRSGWVGTNSFGTLGRLGLSVLKFLQYNKQLALTSPQRRSLAFHKHMVMHMPPRSVSATERPSKPELLYSDTEYEPDSGLMPKLGWVLVLANGDTPIGHAMALPQSIWLSWS